MLLSEALQKTFERILNGNEVGFGGSSVNQNDKRNPQEAVDAAGTQYSRVQQTKNRKKKQDKKRRRISLE